MQAVVSALCDKLLGAPKEQLRDVAALGLKAVVAELQRARAAGLVATATPRLIEGLKAEVRGVGWARSSEWRCTAW